MNNNTRTAEMIAALEARLSILTASLEGTGVTAWPFVVRFDGAYATTLGDDRIGFRDIEQASRFTRRDAVALAGGFANDPFVGIVPEVVLARDAVKEEIKTIEETIEHLRRSLTTAA